MLASLAVVKQMPSSSKSHEKLGFGAIRSWAWIPQCDFDFDACSPIQFRVVDRSYRFGIVVFILFVHSISHLSACFSTLN